LFQFGFIDGLNLRKEREIVSFKENVKSVGIEIKKFFKKNNIKVMINDKKYSIIGRIGMYHAVIDITNSQDVTLESKVVFDVSPMLISNMREYN